LGTVGYCMVLLVTFGYWVVLGCTEVHLGVTRGWGYCGVLRGTAGYCWALLDTTGFCQVLHGTTGYLGGTRCILGEGGVLGVLWDTAWCC